MKTLRLALAGASLAVLMSGTAFAGSYSGWYVGVDANYGSGDANQERFGLIGVTPPPSTQGDASLDGWGFGLHAGFDHAMGANWFIGVEGNYDVSSIGGDDGGSGGDINEWEETSEASLRARLGWLCTPKTAIVLTGGATWADYDANVLNAPTSSRSHTFSGFTYGIGIEHAITPTMRGRISYRHNDYSDDDVSFGPAELYYIQAGPSIDSISFGLTWTP